MGHNKLSSGQIKFLIIMIFAALILISCGSESDSDSDGDGIANRIDNCPLTYNPSQSDHDQNGIGTACTEANIMIAPDSIDIVDSGSVNFIHTHFFTIFVSDSSDLPFRDYPVTISLSGQFDNIQIYDGPALVEQPFNIRTDEYGVYYLRVDLVSGGGINYSGSVDVSTYNNTAYATFSVICN